MCLQWSVLSEIVCFSRIRFTSTNLAASFLSALDSLSVPQLPSTLCFLSTTVPIATMQTNTSSRATPVIKMVFEVLRECISFWSTQWAQDTWGCWTGSNQGPVHRIDDLIEVPSNSSNAMIPWLKHSYCCANRLRGQQTNKVEDELELWKELSLCKQVFNCFYHHFMY